MLYVATVEITVKSDDFFDDDDETLSEQDKAEIFLTYITEHIGYAVDAQILSIKPKENIYSYPASLTENQSQ